MADHGADATGERTKDFAFNPPRTVPRRWRVTTSTTSPDATVLTRRWRCCNDALDEGMVPAGRSAAVVLDVHRRLFGRPLAGSVRLIDVALRVRSESVIGGCFPRRGVLPKLVRSASCGFERFSVGGHDMSRPL